MSVLERVKSGLGIKVVEPQQQPYLRVQEALKPPPVRVIEGGGFAPLKVSETPLQPQIRVSGAPPSPEPKPLLERVQEGIAEFVNPSPKGVRPQDVVRELPQAIGEVAKGIGQSIARSFVATSQTLYNIRQDQDLTTPFTPSTDFEKAVFGTDKPISFESIGREAADILGQGKNIPTVAAIPLGMVFAGLDVIPVASGEKQGLKKAAETIAKLNKADKIFDVLKTVVKGEEPAIRSLAKGLETVTDATQVEKLLTKISDIKVKPIPPELQPLAQEARNLTEVEHARGVLAAKDLGGIQAVGAKNVAVAEKTLQKSGELPMEIKTQKVTKDFIKNYYETKKPPVVGDVFVNAKGERIEITKIKDNAVDYFLKGKKKGIQGTIYTEKGFAQQATKAAKELPELPKVPKQIVAEGARERGFVASVKEKLPNLPKVAGQYIPRSTDELAIKARNLIKDDIRTAENLVAKSTDENAVATASELLKHYSQEAEKATSPAIKEAIYDKAAEVANTMAAKLTEQGRSVQAASILGRLTPEGQVKFAAREIQRFNETAKIQNKIPEINKEQTGYIIDEMKAIGKMEDGIEKAMRFQKLQNYITDLTPSTLIEKLSTIWKAGLLTGIKTTGLNIFSNISHFGSEIVKDIPAVAVDSVAALFTGQRAKTFTLRGIPQGVKEGFAKGARYLKTGFDERNIAQKLDWKRVNFGKSKAGRFLQKYEEAVFRSLGSQDQPFYYGAKARSLYDQATAQAINKGLKGNEAQKFADNLVQNPTDDMLVYAVQDAETAVFQNKTQLGKAAKKMQEIGDGAGNFIVPFGRTPSAVAMQVINYSPAKPIAEIIKLIYNRGKGFDQRAFSQAMGRGLTGTGVMFLGASLFKDKLMNLDYPTGERERELWQLEGRKPNTIKIGDSWRSPMVLGPLGPVLLLGGHFKKQFAESGSPTESFTAAISGMMKSFTEQTFLTGLNSFLDAIKDPSRSAASFAGGFAGSVIPTFIADVARATDSVERRAESILDRVKMRIPGLRESLEPRITVLGDELPRIGNPLEVMIDPTRPSEETVTPVIAEIRRLADNKFNVSPTLLGDKKGYESLTPEQNTELWKRAGTIIHSKLNNLFASENYIELNDEAKSKKIDDFIDKAKTVARAEKILELTQGISGEELKTKLSELKASGLMTRDVYNKYIEIK